MPTVREAINVATPDKLSSYAQQIALGNVIRAQDTTLYQQTPLADSANLATVLVFKLPVSAKARVVDRAYARAGSVTGEYTPGATNTTPTTGKVCVTPSGDIAVLATDAPTGVDVMYHPMSGDALTLTLPVVSNVATIPAAFTTAPAGVEILVACAVNTGTTLGNKIIMTPGATPTTGQAALSTDRATVVFAAADAVTNCTFTVIVTPAIDSNAILESQATF